MPDEEGPNVQGNSKTSTSNNGRYEVIKIASADCVLLVDEQLKDEYRDSLGRTIRSIAISDNGWIVMSFDATDSSIIRIFDGDLKSVVYREPWQLDFGAGLSITSNGRKLAIGSPGENQVYTYDLELETDGSIIRSSRKAIVGPRSEGFGWKVGLSEMGTSIAIASPSAQVDFIDVGAIHVFVLIEGEWEVVNTVLYGKGSILNIGSGGVSVDDTRGIVTVQDSNLIKKSTFMVSPQYLLQH